MNSSSKAVLYAGIAVLCWSTAATMFKIALASYSLLEVLLIASFTSFVVLAIVALIQNKWGVVIRLGRREWAFAAMVGVLNPVAYYLVLFKAYSLLPAQIAQPVNYSWPILLVVMLAVINKKAISRLKLVGLGISLVGVIVISLASGMADGQALPIAGLLVALLSAFLWAVYWIVNSRNQRMDSIVLFLLSFFFGTCYLFVLSMFFPIHVGTTQGILSSIYIGLFEMSIPFIFFGMAARISNNSVLINQLCYLSPFLSLVIIHFVLGEDIRLTTYIGLGLIVFGIVFNEVLARAILAKRKNIAVH
jgi:drug/metabolite transporter (DMT)-like permease